MENATTKMEIVAPEFCADEVEFGFEMAPLAREALDFIGGGQVIVNTI